MADALKPLITEFWVEYAIGNVFLLLRFYARIKVLGVKSLQLDDYFAFAGFLLWIPLIAGMHMTMMLGNNIGLTAETAALVPLEGYEKMIKGSKMGFSTWFIYMTFIWCLKGAVLALCYRIASGLPREINIVKGVAVLSILAYIACMLGHLLQCLPVNRTWQINPYPGDECTLRNANYWIIGTLNSVTDFCIICTPIPILMKVNLSWKRKLLLVPLLRSGIFIMCATILRAYYSLKAITLLPIAAAWASRETFVAAVAVSIPGIKPLFSQSKWLKSQRSAENYGSYNKKSGNGWSASFKQKSGPNFEMSNGGRAWDITASKKHKGERLSSNDSEEYIVQKGAQAPPLDSAYPEDHAITVTRETILSRT